MASTCYVHSFPCLSLHFLSRVLRKYPVIFFFPSNEYAAMEKHFWRDLTGSNQRLSAVLNSLVYEEHNLFSLPTHQAGEQGETRLLKQ